MMKCEKHGTEMKWVGSMVSGSLHCEDCDWASEPCGSQVCGEIISESQKAQTKAPIPWNIPQPNTPPSASGISWDSFRMSYVPLRSATFVPMPAIAKEVEARRRAGFFFGILSNIDSSVTIQCPYCNYLSCLNRACPITANCIGAYIQDLNDGLIDKPITSPIAQAAPKIP